MRGGLAGRFIETCNDYCSDTDTDVTVTSLKWPRLNRGSSPLFPATQEFGVMAAYWSPKPLVWVRVL